MPRELVKTGIHGLDVILADGIPTLISQYRDGRRYDFQKAARWLDERMGPQDAVISDQPRVLAHYLPSRRVERLLADPVLLGQAVAVLNQAGQGGNLWIVAPAPSHAFRTNPGMRNMTGWIYENCQLRNNIGVGRLDFRQNQLQIYRCPPLVPASGAARASGL